ncbi:hypothetical protein Ahy_B03g064124 isoform F [Arachis hypogaea]|uniref:Kinesin motor domain-containing protein n=2 Tax=Arachis hypogaea TaxID=3818 RepID=A0A444ZYQ3_ARAHY|nr:hypothetical protein Ahy_B03g064124 isoform F [Arachis hypogaea]
MQLGQEGRGKGETGSLNGFSGEELGGTVEGSQLASLVMWMNAVLPNLNLPSETSEEELREWLRDGSLLCSLLDQLVPGSLEGRGYLNEPVGRIKKFLMSLDELGLSGFELSDLEQGSMVPVLQSLETLKTQFAFNAARENIQSFSRKRWGQSDQTSLEENDSCLKDTLKFRHAIDGSFVYGGIAAKDQNGLKSNELFQLKQGLPLDLSDAKLMELLKSNNLDCVSTRSLFNIGNAILSDIFERKNGDVPQAQRAGCLLKKILQVIELRVSHQAQSIKNQNNIFKAHEEKYQSRINALETLAAGTTEENEVVASWVQQLKLEQSKFEEKKKLEEQDFSRLKKEKVRNEIEVSTLKQELEMIKRTHEEHVLQLESQATESKVEYLKRISELESLLADARKQVKELEAFSESRSVNWKNKERTYLSFVDCQSRAFQELRAAMKSVKNEVLKTKRSYLEDFKYFGTKLKGLADAAENYHVVLAENRKLYNEVQDLKGNIRVYCRIRPFLPGQNQNHSTIEFAGEDGELIVSNPLKQGKDSRKLFKFNKVFGQAASQEEVFRDTQPLIRSVLDGYNVCIFAYGQTGAGKTYTMQIKYCFLDLHTLGIWNTTQPNGLAVPDASMHSVNSMTDVLELMNIGMTNRATSATALNERSSRSHSVLSIHVRGTDLKTNTLLRGCLHLVDLAGSERVDRSEATGDRLKEAQHINKSLSALGDVIFALAQKSSHVPYRNSKLTQLLQSSLGGQAKTLMFVQLNPDVASYSETISTLKFAERVSGVELGAARSNKEGKDVRELMEQLSSLKDAITRKDEEIERLQSVKVNNNGAKLGTISPRHVPSSPRRHSMGTPRHSLRHSGTRSIGARDKATSDADNCSEYSDRQSEAGSPRSLDDFRHKSSSLQMKLAREDNHQNFNEDIDLLGFGDADSEERLSDISDGGLSMGTETDSISSIVEYTLFPEVEKAAETTPAKNTTVDDLPPQSTGKPIMPSKIPKAPQVASKLPTKPSRLSLNRTHSVSNSSVRKQTAGSSSSAKPLKRWQYHIPPTLPFQRHSAPLPCSLRWLPPSTGVNAAGTPDNATRKFDLRAFHKKLSEIRCSPYHIADFFKDLEINQAQEKLQEIEAMGFGFLKLVPRWPVKQGIMVSLVKAYNTETSTLTVDHGNIRIGPELFQRVFGIPPGVDDFPPFDCGNVSHASIKRRFHRLKTIQHRCFVNHCAMETVDDRMEFRRHFILLVLKMFLCLTVQHVISSWHIDIILDVSDMGRYRWPLHIFNLLEQAIRKYQRRNNKSCESCIFALLECSDTDGNNGCVGEGCASEVTMNQCAEREDAHRTKGTIGSTKTLLKIDAPAVVLDGDDDDDEPIAKKLQRKIDWTRTPEPRMTKGDIGTTSEMDTIERQKGSDKRGRVSNGSMRTNAPSVASDEDDDDDEPIGKILCNRTHHRTEGDTATTSQPETTKQSTEPDDHETKTPSRALQIVASYEGRPHLMLAREDLCTLRPHAWLNNNVVHCMCCAFNDSGLNRFTHDFCVCLGILEMVLVPKNLMHFEDGPNPVYMDLGEHFGTDTRYFDKVADLKRKWDTIKLYRLEIMVDIILCHKNSAIGDALNALNNHSQPAVRRNQPKNKRKEVRTLFTTPGTKSILRQDAGLPKKKPIKMS